VLVAGRLLEQAKIGPEALWWPRPLEFWVLVVEPQHVNSVSEKL
jgi:hypothetical protein